MHIHRRTTRAPSHHELTMKASSAPTLIVLGWDAIPNGTEQGSFVVDEEAVVKQEVVVHEEVMVVEELACDEASID